MIRVADYIAKFLVDNGVTDIFVLTGNAAMYLNDGIVNQKKLKYWCGRHETSAVLMAEGYARLKQSLGAVCVTNGPGSMNAVSGLAEAWVDSAPIIVISGQVPKSHTSYNAKVKGLRSFGSAELNIVPVVESITKYADMVDDPESIRYHLEKAVYHATHGRPGPVWLDIPMDVQSAMINPEKLKGYTPEKEGEIGENMDEKVEAVAKLLLNSKKPILAVGNGVRQSGAIPDFLKLVDVANVPVIASRLGLDILPYSHPLNLGLSGIKGSKYCWQVTKSADLVIALGNRLSVPFVGPKLDAFSNAKVVMVDVDQAELKKPGVHVDEAVYGNVKVFIEKLNDRLKNEKPVDRKEWLQSCSDFKKKYPMVTDELKKNPIDLYYFMSRLDAVSGKHNNFVTDAGSNYYVGGQVFKFEHGQREITSANFAAMGLSIPLAIGSSAANRDAQILAVTGDGSLELNIQELKTISYYGLNVKLFVINNGGYASMRNWQDSFFEGRHIGSDDASGMESLNLEKVAQAFDLRYERISNHEEIDSKLKSILKDDKPIFVEVLCDNNQKIIAPLEKV
jgi:acetolactate synthase I/II/III large subunit